MSKCKNCLSEEVCRYNDGHNLYCKDEYVCPHFTDRSEWVHLPCKVGDKIYQTDGIRIYESTIQDFNAEYMIFCTENISFDERAIGNGIFLTRKEAEKALEGKE